MACINIAVPKIIEVRAIHYYAHYYIQLVQVFDESIIEASGGKLVRLPEIGSRLAVGDQGTVCLLQFAPAFLVNSYAHRISYPLLSSLAQHRHGGICGPHNPVI